MAFALTRAQAYGTEVEEAVNKKYKQVLILTFTAANTDVDLDLGDYAGTFWDAVDGSQPGIDALLAIKDIQTRAETFLGIGGTAIAGYSQADASGSSIIAIDSAASLGGAATEAVALTGALSTDTILAVSQKVKGANSTALNGFATLIDNGITLSWTANPGASSVATVLLQRAGITTPAAGTYTVVMNATNTQLPDILFVTGNAPAGGIIALEWTLKPQQQPVYLDKTA